MAATTYGTAWVYGIRPDAPTNATVISDSKSRSDRITATVPNHSGQIVHERDDDELETRTLTLRIDSNYITANNAATIGGLLSYDNTNYKILSEEDAQEAEGLTQVTLNLQAREYLDYGA